MRHVQDNVAGELAAPLSAVSDFGHMSLRAFPNISVNNELLSQPGFVADATYVLSKYPYLWEIGLFRYNLAFELVSRNTIGSSIDFTYLFGDSATTATQNNTINAIINEFRNTTTGISPLDGYTIPANQIYLSGYDPSAGIVNRTVDLLTDPLRYPLSTDTQIRESLGPLLGEAWYPSQFGLTQEADQQEFYVQAVALNGVLGHTHTHTHIDTLRRVERSRRGVGCLCVR
jgi:hypothetical protein